MEAYACFLLASFLELHICSTDQVGYTVRNSEKTSAHTHLMESLEHNIASKSDKCWFGE